MVINLPDLQVYKVDLIKKGAKYPLAIVDVNKTGLLNSFPVVSTTKTGWPWTNQTNPAIYDSKINWPKLTIVTPSYNQAQFIEETIRSVLLQNYPNLEYMVIDGGSTDGSVEIIKKYSPWISYWKSETDRGQAHAINMGFSIASGNYYAWINSDDYYLENTFFKVVSEFMKSNTSFIYGYAMNFITNEQKFNLIKTSPLIDYFIRIPTLAQPSCFWDANIHQPLWEELHCSLDYELWLRMVKGKKRKLIKASLSVANIHINAKTSGLNTGELWAHDHELICSEDAHGPVKNWDNLVKLKKLFGPFIKLWA